MPKPRNIHIFNIFGQGAYIYYLIFIFHKYLPSMTSKIPYPGTIPSRSKAITFGNIGEHACQGAPMGQGLDLKTPLEGWISNTFEHPPF
jgi:hypothetical protein